MQQLTNRTIEQICGPCLYLGRIWTQRGLGITQAEWQANREHTVHGLEPHGIPVRGRNEFLELFERYRIEIVETP